MDPQREADFLAGKNYGERAKEIWGRWLNFRNLLSIGVARGLEGRYLETLGNIREEYQKVSSLLNEYDIKSERAELQELEKQMIQEEQKLRKLLDIKKG